jgi:type I restriction enzyme S subunit
MNMVSVCTNQSIAAIFPNESVFISDFIYYYLDSRYDELRRLSAGGEGRGGLNLQLIKNLAVALPPLHEQQKIANCFTSLDEVIAAQGQKLDALKAHKRGLMQQLFPREGETRPRLRFPEFRDKPEWEPKQAGELFVNRSADGTDGLSIYSVTIHDGMVKRSTFERDFYDIEDPAGNKKACMGDIAYNMMRMWQGALGVAPEDCMVSPAYVVLAPLEGVCSDFFAYLFKLPQSLRLLTSHSRGLTKDRLRLYYKDFTSVPLRCPSVVEQRMIADFLASCDFLIAAESRKLDALKTHKKGLMQQLFPAGEES